jgi:hypothetical protein
MFGGWLTGWESMSGTEPVRLDRAVFGFPGRRMD